MNITKKTKIITTIGPVSENEKTIRAMFEAGMTTIRLNFSHGNYEEHGARIVIANKLSKELGMPISVMLDTKGPEIRVGKFKDGKQAIDKGATVTIFTDADSYKNKQCGKNEMTTAYDMSQDLEKGKVILVDDGKLVLNITSVKPGVIEATAVNTHVVKENKRINLPGTKFSMAFLSPKDIKDIEYGCDMDVDYVAASFVNTKEDIEQIRGILAAKGKPEIKIFAKIESQFAVDNFDEILKATDGVMVARGDLGLEIPYYEVPVAQKMMIRKCREAAKPVIVATQMLDSMETNPSPTRAEVTDVYLATELGADATMLSGESAAGQFPVEAVRVMAKINSTAEKEFYNKLYYPVQLATIKKNSSGPRAIIAEALALRTQSGDFDFAVVLSRTGKLLEEVAKFRPNAYVIGISNDKKLFSKYGITSTIYMYPESTIFDDLKKNPKDAAKIAAKYGAKKGTKILLVENEKITEQIV